MTPKPHPLPRGIDLQGRHPEAAHAATDAGVPEDLNCAAGVLVFGPLLGLAIWLIVAIAFVAVLWP